MSREERSEGGRCARCKQSRALLRCVCGALREGEQRGEGRRGPRREHGRDREWLTRRADRTTALAAAAAAAAAGRVDRIGELFSLFREGLSGSERERERERERGCKLLRHTTHSLTHPPTRSVGVGGAQTEAQSLREEGNNVSDDCEWTVKKTIIPPIHTKKKKRTTV